MNGGLDGLAKFMGFNECAEAGDESPADRAADGRSTRPTGAPRELQTAPSPLLAPCRGQRAEGRCGRAGRSGFELLVGAIRLGASVGVLDAVGQVLEGLLHRRAGDATGHAHRFIAFMRERQWRDRSRRRTG